MNLPEGATLQEIVITGWMEHQGKLVLAFTPLEVLQTDPERRYWYSSAKGAKCLTGAKPGAIYSRAITPNGGGWTSGDLAPKYVRMHEDAAQVARWQLASKAASLEHDAKRRAKQGQNLDQLLVGLKPFRDVYQGSGRQTQRALLLLAIEYLTKGT